VTIAGQAPKNLVHVVLEGRTYDTSGGQPTPGEGRTDLAALATAAGYRRGVTIDDEEALAKQWPELLTSEGPTFVCIRVNSMWAFGPMPGLGGNVWQDVAKTLAAI
jgi:phosphonopyruvate decarboxylase